MNFLKRLFRWEKTKMSREPGYEPQRDIDRRRQMDAAIAERTVANRALRQETVRDAQETMGYYSVMGQWVNMKRAGL